VTEAIAAPTSATDAGVRGVAVGTRAGTTPEVSIMATAFYRLPVRQGYFRLQGRGSADIGEFPAG
jgi:hypothetical protein